MWTACVSVQSDQQLCSSLSGKYHDFTCYMQSLNIVASLCSWAGWIEPNLGANPKDKFSPFDVHK